MSNYNVTGRKLLNGKAKGGNLPVNRTLFRCMKRDMDGRPAVGNSADRLGVRIANAPGEPDIYPVNGMVAGHSGGMSATVDDPEMLPGHRKPKWLEGTARKGELFLIDGGLVTQSLAVEQRGHDINHYEFLPAYVMRIDDYQSHLESTRAHWIHIQDRQALQPYMEMRA